MTNDPYTDPATGTLVNLLGISSPEVLASVEADLSKAAIADLTTGELQGRYDLDHLRAFHREIFGDLCPWAGEIRTVAIAKTDPFCLPQHIESYAAQVFDALAKEGQLRDHLGAPRMGGPPDLQAWLDSGESPVFFGFGSMPIVDPRRMLADLAEVTRMLGVRGLIGAGWTAYDDIDLPDHLYLERGHVDHERVLPQCVAAVHHGGAGTAATVTRAGIASVVVSVFLDQPFWGWRIAQAGLGSTFPFRAPARSAPCCARRTVPNAPPT